MPKNGATLDIKPEVARKFYERTIGGSPYREGKLNWELLMGLIKDKSPGPRILKLLPDVVVEFTPKSYKPIKGKKSTDVRKFRWAGRVTRKGKVVGEGIFIVDEKLRRITATIQYNDKVYQIVPLKNGNVRILQLNANRYPDESTKTIDSVHDESDIPNPRPELAGPPPTESGSQSCVIDVLVLYTQDAEETWLDQGYEDIWLEFDNAIEITNEAFAYSDVHAEVQIVGRKLISRDLLQEEDSLDSALGKLQDTGGFELAKKVSEWRDAAGADLVSLWVAGGDSCGASPYFTKRPPDKSGKEGFSVVVVGCAAVNQSLAHEIGHNLGARHSRVDEGVGGGESAHNFGHLSVNDAVRTIMSLNDTCKAEGVYCRRETHYSNPDIKYPGTQTKTGVKKGDPNAADNHAQLNDTVCEAAAYRPHRD